MRIWICRQEYALPDLGSTSEEKNYWAAKNFLQSEKRVYSYTLNSPMNCHTQEAMADPRYPILDEKPTPLRHILNPAFSTLCLCLERPAVTFYPDT
jgi:hypothetical protein